MKTAGVIFMIFLALVCGGIASTLAYNYLKNQPTDKGPELEPLVVAAKDLTFGETLELGDMIVVLFPKGSIPKGSYSNPDSLVGKSTKVFLKAKEPILDSKLSSIGGGLSLLIDKDMRAASIQVDKVSGVSGFILPGDRVDVISTVDRLGTKQDVVAKTILQKIEVLAAGEKTERKGDKVITVQAVTLLVDPDGAQALALASQEGKMHLALRNPTDDEVLAVAPISKAKFWSTKKTEKPKVKKRSKSKPKKKVTKPVEIKEDSLVIIRGTDKKTETPVMTEEKKAGSTKR